MAKNYFKEGEFYHVFNKSIAGFGIFKDPNNAQRFINALDYYNSIDIKKSYSVSLRKNKSFQENILIPRDDQKIKCICYCIMPDHYHLVVRIKCDDLFWKYISDVENSYSRYFNTRFDRKGPLWQGRFKAVKIRSNEQLLHVTRYVHINPTTAYLVEKPEDWIFSSYRKIISDQRILKENLREISIRNYLTYKKFCEDNIDYQRNLKRIKKLIF